jgi:hypothetical protein
MIIGARAVLNEPTVVGGTGSFALFALGDGRSGVRAVRYIIWVVPKYPSIYLPLFCGRNTLYDGCNGCNGCNGGARTRVGARDGIGVILGTEDR